MAVAERTPETYFLHALTQFQHKTVHTCEECRAGWVLLVYSFVKVAHKIPAECLGAAAFNLAWLQFSSRVHRENLLHRSSNVRPCTVRCTLAWALQNCGSGSYLPYLPRESWGQETIRRGVAVLRQRGRHLCQQVLSAAWKHNCPRVSWHTTPRLINFGWPWNTVLCCAIADPLPYSCAELLCCSVLLQVAAAEKATALQAQLVEL